MQKYRYELTERNITCDVAALVPAHDLRDGLSLFEIFAQNSHADGLFHGSEDTLRTTVC